MKRHIDYGSTPRFKNALKRIKKGVPRGTKYNKDLGKNNKPTHVGYLPIEYKD